MRYIRSTATFLVIFSIETWLAHAIPHASAQQQLIFGGQPAAPVRREARVVEQNDSLCDAGSKQWTGFVPINPTREMFFWYFESRTEPENAPLIIWVNGGPGGSSLLGAFFEIGPCKVDRAGNSTSRNLWSWTNFANVLFIDQPIGVGFSFTNDSSLWAKTLDEAENDISKFFDIFLEELFPNLLGRPMHFAGESFGGQYVPHYVSKMRRSFSSIILANALISFPKSMMGFYEHFCTSDRDSKPDTPATLKHFNETDCTAMAAAYPNCYRSSRLCDTTYQSEACIAAYDACRPIQDVVMEKVIPGGLNPYDDRKDCVEPPLCGHLGMEDITSFLNLNNVQRAIGLENKIDYETVNMDLNEQWSNGADMFIPSSREITAVLDIKHTRVLVINGNNDIIVNTEGIKRTYDDIIWTGQAQFLTGSYTPIYKQRTEKLKVHIGEFKRSGNLTVVSIDEAGHIAPHDQPQTIVQVVHQWTSHIKSAD